LRYLGFDDAVRRAAYDFVRERVNNVVLTPSPAAEREPPTKRCKVENDGLEFLLGETKSSSTSETQSDFDRYLVAANSVEDGETALQWWRRNNKAFPKKAAVARKYLAILATSVQSERLFSVTGRLISKARSRLLPDMLIRWHKTDAMMHSFSLLCVMN